MSIIFLALTFVSAHFGTSRLPPLRGATGGRVEFHCNNNRNPDSWYPPMFRPGRLLAPQSTCTQYIDNRSSVDVCNFHSPHNPSFEHANGSSALSISITNPHFVCKFYSPHSLSLEHANSSSALNISIRNPLFMRVTSTFPTPQVLSIPINLVPVVGNILHWGFFSGPPGLVTKGWCCATPPWETPLTTYWLHQVICFFVVIHSLLAQW